MFYTLSINEPGGPPNTLTLSGCLTIKNSFALHAELLEHAKKQEGMRLELRAVEELDTAFLQLLLALSKYHAEHKKPFYLHLDLNPVFCRLMQVAGVTKSLNHNLT